MPNENKAVELDIANLPRHQQRKFIADSADLTDVAQVVGYLNKLLALDISSADTLEEFVLNRSEVGAALGQVRSALYIRMTCQTDDKSRAEAYTKFMSEVMPAVKPLADKLDRKYLDAKQKFGNDKERYMVYDRGIETDIDLFREANVPLQTEDDMLSQEYQTISGAMTVELDGKEYTMPQIASLQLETDRDLRERAWRATTDRRLVDADKLDSVFDKMLVVREKLAANTSMESFREYQFKSYHRFDYTPADCKQFHKTVEEIVVPVLGDINERRRTDMGLDTLRPWDTAVDPLGREPLKPFETVEQFIAGTHKMFSQVDSDLGDQFKKMADLGLLDLFSRKGKAPGGYQSSLTESRVPFIFVNAVGVNNDLITLLHEGGHAFHTFASADDPLLDYRHAPMEFCEVASMSMELLSMPYLSEFYNEQDAIRAKVNMLKRSVSILPSVALIDKFQHWIYENPKCDAAQRADMFKQINDCYTAKGIDYTGLEKQQAYDWHRILHIFQVPFYYIEYAIAQLGALQIWQQSKTDHAKAVANYRKALALGGSKPLPELFAAAGIKFDFTAETIGPLMEEVAAELKSLEA